MSVFTMMFLCGFIIGLCSLYLFVVVAKIDPIAMSAYLGAPFIPKRTPAYAFVSAFVIALLSHVASILSWSANTKIATGAIQTVSVSMVNFLFFWRIGNKTMQKYFYKFYAIMLRITNRVEVSISALHRAPLEFRNSRIVSITNFCKLSLSEFDYLHVLTNKNALVWNSEVI